MNVVMGCCKALKREAWAVTDEVKEMIRSVYGKVRNHTYTQADAEIVKAAIGQKIDNGYDVQVSAEGICTIKVRGVLMREPGFIEEVCFGAASTMTLESDLVKAFQNDKVSGIVLDVDSPGGAVAGTRRLNQVIGSQKEETGKPIVSYTGGLMASAAYWFGSRADAVIAEDTADVGSIGVIMTHIDESEALKKEGLKVTHITGGKDKALGTSTEPLSKRAIEYFQAIVDETFEFFKADVSANRGGKVDIDGVANGRIFTATQALANGLIDKIGTYEDAIEMVKTIQKGESMTLAELKEKHGDVAAEYKTEIVAEIEETHKAAIEKVKTDAEAEKAQAVADALAAEKTRQSEIKALALPGQAELCASLIESGASKEEAMAQFLADAKARPEAAKVPGDADKALALLNGQAPKAATQPEDNAGGEPKSKTEEWQAIKDPVARAAFFQENKDAINAERRVK